MLLGCLGLAFLFMVGSLGFWFLSSRDAPAVATAPQTAIPAPAPIALPMPPAPTPVPTAPPPAVVTPAPEVDPLAAVSTGTTVPNAGSLAVSDVQRVIRSHHADTVRCFEDELSRNPNASGRVVIALSIAPSGVVSSARATEDTFSSSRVADCAVRAVRRWVFPAHEGTIEVSYPFLFTAGH